MPEEDDFYRDACNGLYNRGYFILLKHGRWLSVDEEPHGGSGTSEGPLASEINLLLVKNKEGEFRRIVGPAFNVVTCERDGHDYVEKINADKPWHFSRMRNVIP